MEWRVGISHGDRAAIPVGHNPHPAPAGAAPRRTSDAPGPDAGQPLAALVTAPRHTRGLDRLHA